MGTAGVTHFHNGGIDAPSICYVYKQSAGYPDILGEEIKEVFGEANLVNGIRFDLDNQVNGMGCAAAQFIARTKTGVGGVYILGESVEWADYDYHIFYNGKWPYPNSIPGHLMMKIMSGKETVWEGLISEFDSASLHDDEEA